MAKCETCRFWKKEFRNQFKALCINPKEPSIKRKFNDSCFNHEPSVIENSQMQSNTRG